MAASTTRTVKAKFDGDAKGMIAAAAEGEAAIDRFGKNTEKKFNKSGEKAAKGFSNSIRKWFGGAGGLKEVGDSGGTVFGSGFLGALKTPVLGPAIAGALTAAVAVAAPAAGAVAASGLVGAFGAGLAGLGIVFAAKSEAVRKKWRDTTTGMGKDMQLFAKPYEATLIHAADVAQKVFNKFAPSLQASFKETAPVVSEFVDETGAALEELQPAIRPISEGFQAVLRSLGPAMQSAMRNVSNGLITLSESVKKNPDGLADLVDGVGALTNKALGAITVLNNLNGTIENLTGGTSAVDILFGKANSTIGSGIGIVRRAIDPFSSLKGVVGLLGHETKQTTANIQDNQATLGLWTQGLTAQQAAAVSAGAAVGSTRTQFERQAAATANLTATYNRQKAATDALIASLFRQQGIMLGLSGAQISYEQAVDDATASIKENGKTLDIHSEKGRNNRAALNSLAAAANQQTQAMIESGKGTVAAARQAESSRANFIRLATQMGLSRSQAKQLASQLIAIPNVTRTAKLEANKKDLDAKLAAAKKQLADPKLSATKKAELRAEISNLEAGIYRANHLLASVPSSKTVTIRYTTSGVNVTTPSSVGRRASGGDMQPGRRYLLGERRAEIVEMGQNGGARVISGEQTPRELDRGGQPIIVENHIEIGGEVVRVVRSEISTDKRNTKRKVTAK